jgi:ferredoxin
VGAAMALHILKGSSLLGADFPASKRATFFDMSVGYSLEGIQSARMRHWIESMKNARPVIDELRGCLTGPLARYRDLDFPAEISNSIALSTFHGCPADEIERICTFLLCEMGVDVCIKMNPTLLGRPEVEHLLHGVLGYDEIRVVPEAFDKDLKFDEALDIVGRLDGTARASGRRLAVKFSNTLVVANQGSFFSDPVMYLSGQPLHVITLNLLKKWRDEELRIADCGLRIADQSSRKLARPIPISFSAGVDAQNFPAMVALNMAPITTCTDLLRPGGYGRLVRYLDNLEAKMRGLAATTRDEFVVRCGGAGEQAIRGVTAGLGEQWNEAAGVLEPRQLAAGRNWLANAGLCLQAWWNRSGDEMGVRRLSETDPGGWADATESADKRLAQVAAAIAGEFERNVRPMLPEPIARRLEHQPALLAALLVERAGLLNTAPIVERTTADPRYAAGRNRGVPRKIGSHLVLFDCIQCDKCVPVCPNDANFVYATEPGEFAYNDYVVRNGALVVAATGVMKLAKAQQIANYADFCNDCGNCDVHCPEDGGPQIEKPRFFGSRDSYRAAGRQGFYIEYAGNAQVIYGTLEGKSYRVAVENGRTSFDDGVVEVEFRGHEVTLAAWKAKPEAEVEGHIIRLLPYLQLRCLLQAVSDPSKINFVNLHERKEDARS